jgi:hypothetical protein
MGCQCNNQKEEQNNELSKNNENLDDYNNNEQKDEIFGLSNQDGLDPENLIEADNEKENDNQINHQNEDKNAKYADYPKKMLELINKIRSNPSSYADIILDGINNIIINQDFDETKPKIIYKHKVKVALSKGEPAFREAAEILKEMQPLPALEFKEEICVPLPETEEELNDHSYLKRQINIIQENNNVDLFFKDLIKLPEVSTLLMIVDDSEKNPGKKRNALLNEEFKYIGISNKFIGKKFIAYFTFSK